METKSAIRTLTNKIKKLESECLIWGKGLNYNHEILGIVLKEIEEHKQALKKLKN